MARKLYEKQAVRRRTGALANGVVLVVYTDEAGTVPADVSATLGGSAIAGSVVTTADIAGLGPASLRFYGPSDGTDTLYMRVPSDASLGVQKIEADPDPRLDALEAGGGGGGIAATIVDAKGDLIAGSSADTVARLAVGANGYGLVADSAAATGLKWLSPPVVNVKAPPYNAVGDGSTDDRAAVQAAADAIGSDGGVLYFPPGIYRCATAAHPTDGAYKAALVVKSKTHVLFASGAVLKLYDVQTGTAGSQGIIMNREISAGGEQYTFEDVVVDGNAANQTSVQHGIFLVRASFAKHVRCRVFNCRGTASSGANETFHYEAQLSSNVSYTDCDVVSAAASTASGFSADVSTNVTYKGCTATGMTNAHGFTHNGCIKVSYVGCRSYLNAEYGFNSEVSTDVLYDTCVAGGEATTSAVSYPFTAGQSLGNTSTGFVANSSSRVEYLGCDTQRNGNGMNLTGSSGRMVAGSVANNGSGILLSGISANSFHIDPTTVFTGNASTDLNIPSAATVRVASSAITPAPSVPASTVALTNPFPFPVTVLVVGGTVTAIKVDEQTTGVTAGPVPLAVGAAIRLTHSSAPTWTWLRAGAGRPFSASQISGLHTDLDADLIAGIADTGAVTTWSDTSGNGHDATQATAGNRPTLAVAGLGSRPSVLFDGTDDGLATASFTATATSTIVAVVKALTTTGDRQFIDGGVVGNRHLLGIQVGNWFGYQGGGGVTAGPAADTNPHVIVGLFAGTAASRIAVDGTLAAASNVGTDPLTKLSIGRDLLDANNFHGHVARLLVYSRVLTTAEWQAVARDLGAEYGITVA